MNRITNWIKNHPALSTFAGILLLTLGIGFSFRARSQSGTLLTDPLKKGRIVESIYGIGTVTATKSFQIRPGITSTVAKLYVREGDAVKKGDRLVVMDPTTVFTAPFNGTVTYLPVKIGENVFPQSVVMNVVDLADRYLVVTLEQQGALRVRQGQKAKLSFDSLRNEMFEGVVESIYSSGNNFLVRIGVSKLPAQILPGMTVDVAITISERVDVLLAPVAAIENGKVYFSRDSGRPKAIEIKTGLVDGAMAELISDVIHEGDRLVIRKKVTP